MDDPLRHIADVMDGGSGNRLSSQAKKRLERDVSHIVRRIDSGEYERSGWAAENQVDLPEKTRQFHAHFETYARIGELWEQLLKLIPVASFPTVLDICPGSAPKVELGLHYAGYTGHVVVLDSDEEELHEMMRLLRLVRPQFHVSSWVADFFTQPDKTFPAVFGNHIIDDLAFSLFGGKFGVSIEEIYGKEGVFEQFWGKLLTEKEKNVSELADAIAAQLPHYVDNKGFLVLFHYPSFMETMLGNFDATQFSFSVFAAVTDKLTASGFSRLPVPVDVGDGQAALLQKNL